MKWTQEQVDVLIKEYPTTKNKILVEKINKSEASISQKARKLGVKKSADYVNPSLFKKGHKTYNKGVKMPIETYNKLRCTMFQKGHKINKSSDVGTERITKDFVVIKTESGEWKQKQVHIYEQNFGKIKKGEVVKFLDGNNRNFELSNLKCVSRIENMLLNSKTVTNKKIVPTLTLICKIKNKIKELENEK